MVLLEARYTAEQMLISRRLLSSKLAWKGTSQFTKISFSKARRYKMTDTKLNKDESEWRAILTPAQFAVLREKATERPNTGEYNHFAKEGVYDCAGCGQPLYRSTTKFDSGCGWPAFYEGLPGAIKTETDSSMGRVRTEIMCSNCGGHLGHVFKGEGFKTPTDERHCVNSISLKFKEK